MGAILGIVLLAVLLVAGGRYFYRKLYLERSERYHKCRHCGEYYEGSPFYCPHCGEVVDRDGQDN